MAVNGKPLHYLTIDEAAKLIRKRALSPVELTRAILDRIAHGTIAPKPNIRRLDGDAWRAGGPLAEMSATIQQTRAEAQDGPLAVVVGGDARVEQLIGVVEQRRAGSCRRTPRVTNHRTIRSPACCRGAVQTLHELVLENVGHVDAIERLRRRDGVFRRPGRTRLCRDQHHAICSTGAVDRRSRGALENLDRLDVRRVDVRRPVRRDSARVRARVRSRSVRDAP